MFTNSKRIYPFQTEHATFTVASRSCCCCCCCCCPLMLAAAFFCVCVCLFVCLLACLFVCLFACLLAWLYMHLKSRQVFTIKFCRICSSSGWMKSIDRHRHLINIIRALPLYLMLFANPFWRHLMKQSNINQSTLPPLTTRRQMLILNAPMVLACSACSPIISSKH